VAPHIRQFLGSEETGLATFDLPIGAENLSETTDPRSENRVAVTVTMQGEATQQGCMSSGILLR
jgi:hypothetical protein